MKRAIASPDDVVIAEALNTWPHWIFAHLPLAYAVRVTDSFLVGGHKFLLRVAVALVYLWKRAKRVLPEDPDARVRASQVNAQIAQVLFQ